MECAEPAVSKLMGTVSVNKNTYCRSKSAEPSRDDLAWSKQNHGANWIDLRRADFDIIWSWSRIRTIAQRQRRLNT